jgi:hypothetical protein
MCVGWGHDVLRSFRCLTRFFSLLFSSLLFSFLSSSSDPLSWPLGGLCGPLVAAVPRLTATPSLKVVGDIFPTATGEGNVRYVEGHGAGSAGGACA